MICDSNEGIHIFMGKNGFFLMGYYIENVIYSKILYLYNIWKGL